MPSTLIYFICELRTVMFLLSVCQYWTQVLDIVTSSLFHLCHRWSSLAHNRWVLRVGHYRNQLRTWLGWIMNFLILSNKLYDNATENPYIALYASNLWFLFAFVMPTTERGRFVFICSWINCESLSLFSMKQGILHCSIPLHNACRPISTSQ